MQKLLACVCLCTLSLPAFAEEEKPEANPLLELKIAIPIHHNHRSLNTSGPMHVLVKNVSDAPLRLWTDKYSWGYRNLSFELVGDDGSVTKISKKPREWSKNFPDWLELKPGDTYVLSVDLLDKTVWENAVAATPGKSPTQVKLRAVYQINPDEQATKNAVWTGKLQTAVDTYAIW
ncbi:hypothetical protein [Anatilimnocola floriformis]|uniref:hypothetical protein n=1 Tax=Anatilimnocola floriformis TaxID=2948575 RepID=UPI0020C30677|nr:hypothetical protein [Anatilimnocola floriformis]